MEKDFATLLAEDTASISKKYGSPNKVGGSFGRQFSYGISQGTQTLGNIGRTLKSFTESSSRTGDFSYNSKLNEIFRQAEIADEFPEYRNLNPEDRTGAMVFGEVATAVADPVMAVMPFTRLGQAAYKAGSLAQAGLYGTVAGVEDVARQLGTLGEVDAYRTALVTTAGGVTAGVLDKAIKSFPAVKETFKNKIAKTKEQSEVIDDMANIAAGKKPRLKVDVEGNVIPGEKPRVKVPAFTQEEKVVVDRAVKNNPKVSQVAFEDLDFQGRLIQISRIDKIIERTQKRIDSGLKKYNIPKLKEKLKQQLQYKERLESNISEDMIQNYKKQADTTIDLLEDMAEKGELTEGIFSKVLSEFTRPAFGATGGAIVGNLFDDDGDHNAMYWGIALGAGGGFLQKRLATSTSLSSLKDNGDLIIDNAIAQTASRMMSKLKYQTASTAATKMDAAGGWTQLIGNKLFSRIASGDISSVEARTIQKQDEYFSKLAQAVQSPTLRSVLDRVKNMTDGARIDVGDEIFAINTVAGEVMRGLTDINAISVGYRGLTGKLKPLSAEDIAEIKIAVPKLTKLRDEHKEYVQAAGINLKQDLGDDYGLPQLWDEEFINTGYNAFLTDIKKAFNIQKNNGGREVNADKFASKVSGRDEFTTSEYGQSSSPVFITSPVSNKKIFRQTANYFENARQLTDKEAVKFLASKGWLKLDAHEALAKYGFESTKVAEFSRTFGANGEVINLALDRIVKGFNVAASKAPAAQRSAILDEGRAQAKLITDGVEAYWGKLGQTRGLQADTSVRALQALANMKYLTTVTIANLPDLLQPFINSNFGTAAKVAAGRFSNQPSFAQQGTFKYSNSWERELQNFLLGGQIKSRSSAFIVNSQDLFFQGVGLKKVTEASRNFAYDVGVNRVYNLAKKAKLNKSERAEIKTLLGKNTTVDDLKTIKKYKTVQEAFEADDAKAFLDLAGRQAADRDAIIPLVGNRLLFTQSRDPLIRATGQFLSWTMAKSAQLNKILSRVEDGDAQLALRMLAAVPIYGGLRELKGMINPGTKVDAYEDEDLLDKTLKSIRISGQANNWAIDKIAEVMKYNLSSRSNTTGGIAPAFGFLEEGLKSLMAAAKDVGEGEFGEAAKKVGETLPITSQAIDITEKVQDAFAVGGEVDVPRAAPEPDERIDKMTGLPYNIQAGIPFRDEEDPIKRLGLAGGGMSTDPLQRLKFSLGSAVTPLVTNLIKKAAVKTADESVGNIFKTSAAKNLANATPDGSVDDVAKSLQTKTMSELDTMVKAEESKNTWDILKVTDKKIQKFKDSNTKGANLEANKELEEAALSLADDSIPMENRILNFRKVLETGDNGKPLIKEWNIQSIEALQKSLPSNLEIALSVGKKSKDKKIIGLNDNLKTGDLTEFRLDIPAYRRFNIWTLTAHKPVKGKSIGETVAYGKTGRLTNVTFKSDQPEATWKIAAGEQDKFPMATMVGNWVEHTPEKLVEEALTLLRMKNSEWKQIGFNPKNSSQFYDRKSLKTVTDAEEIIQVGGFIIAKNPTLTDMTAYFRASKPIKLKTGKTIDKGTLIPFSVGGVV